MRLRLWQKLILVVCVFSVLAFSFCLTSGATNYIEDVGSVYRPLFAPRSISIVSDWPDTVCIDVNSSLCLNAADSSYSTSSNISVDGGSYDYSVSFSKVGDSGSLYGYKSILYGYVAQFDGVPNSDGSFVDYVDFYFSDLYLTPSSLANTSFFGSLDLYLDIDGNEYTGGFYCSWRETYIDSEGRYHTQYNIEEFSSFGDLLFSYEDLYYPNGLFLSEIVFTLYNDSFNEFTSDFYISGSSPFSRIDSIPTPLYEWRDFFTPSITIIESPTILESIQSGLDAVWNTSLFGLFTIGTVFSACAGVALFAWLLKIFNR